jgi:hypothetical protein
VSLDTPSHATANDPLTGDYRTPRWRTAIRCAFVAITVIWLVLLGLEFAHVTLGAAPLPAVVQNLALAAFAALLVSVIADIAFTRTLHTYTRTVRGDLTVVRYELAASRRENSEMREQMNELAGLIARTEARRANDIAALHQAIADNAAHGWYAGYAQAAKDELRETDGGDVVRLPTSRSARNTKWSGRDADDTGPIRHPSSH